MLSPGAKPKRGLRPWTADVADHLAELPAEELRHWQQLVLGMVVREQHRMPARWERVATAFIDEVGAGLVATRLQEFWPARHAEVSLKHGGAQLLKHFVWMLSLLPDQPTGDELASRIPTMTWRRQDPPREAFSRQRLHTWSHQPRQQLAGRERCFYSRSRQRALSCHLRNVTVSVAGAINPEARRISCAARYL